VYQCYDQGTYVTEMATEGKPPPTYNALRLFHEGHDCIQEASMAKLMTQRAVLEIADQPLQIHGGYGYIRGYAIERAVPAVRLGPLGGGTDEIMKEILGKGARALPSRPVQAELQSYVQFSLPALACVLVT